MDDRLIDEMFAFEDRHWWFVGKRLLVASLLHERLRQPGLRILDVGCGTGAVLAHLRSRARVAGVDRSPRALAHCRRRGLDTVVCAEMDRLPFGTARFDIILMLDVLEHFADDVSVVAGARSLLRPGGSLLVSVPAFQALWSEHDEALHHVRRYTARRLRHTLEAGGLVVRRLTYTNVAALAPALLLRALLPRLGVRRPGGTDFREHAPWVNRLLLATYELEAAALRVLPRLPLGLSAAAVAELPRDDSLTARPGSPG
jgi:SAM-dependent methyltransferase